MGGCSLGWEANALVDQSWIFRYPLFVLRNLPSAENERTIGTAPTSRVCCSAPDLVSHSLIVLSRDADASCLPSCENTTDRTEREWHFSVCCSAPDLVSHNLMVLSSDADASRLPSGKNATDKTEPEWSFSVCCSALQLSFTSGDFRIHRGM